MARQFYEITATCIGAADLVKIANQVFNDKMQFVQLSIINSSREDEDGNVLIDALPSIDSDDPVHYPEITSFSLLDSDAFGFRD